MHPSEIITGLLVMTIPVAVLIGLGWFGLNLLNRRDRPRRRDDDPGESFRPRPSSPPGSERLVPRYGPKAAPSSTRHPAAPGHSRSRQPQDVGVRHDDDGISIPAINNPAVYVSDSSTHASESSIRGSCSSGGFTQDNSPSPSTYSSSDTGSSSSSDSSSSSSCE